LTHTKKSKIATKKPQKPKFSRLFGAARQIRTADLILTKNEVDFLLPAIPHHLLVAGAIILSQARGGIIVNSDKLPAGIPPDVIAVKFDLILQTVLLLLMARADSAVGRHPKLLDPNRYKIFTLWYLDNISGHNKTFMLSTHVLMSSITWRFLQKEKLHFSLIYKAKM
jgi:hypothetical protein